MSLSTLRPHSKSPACSNLIEQHTKSVLYAHAEELKQYIDLNVLIPYLKQEGLLTKDETYTVGNPYLPPGKGIQILLTYMSRKGRDGPNRFVECIRKSASESLGHAHLVNEVLALGTGALTQQETSDKPADNDHNQKRMRQRFAYLLLRVSKELKNIAKEDMGGFRVYISNLPASENDPLSSIARSDREKIQGASAPDEIFHVLTNGEYWGYRNLFLLHAIVETFGSMDLIHEVAKYREQLLQFESDPSFIPSGSPPEVQKMAQLSQKFLNVFINVQKRFEELDVLDRLKVFATLLPMEYGQMEQLHSDAIASASDVSSIFGILGYYWDWQRFRPLKCIVDTLGTSEVQRMVSEYDREFKLSRASQKQTKEIERELFNYRIRFAHLVLKILIYFEKSNITLDAFHKFLASRQSAYDQNRHIAILDPAFDTAKSWSEMFLVLNHTWDHFNFELLHEVLKNFQIQELLPQFRHYQHDIHSFAVMTKLSDLVQALPSIHPPARLGFVKLSISFDATYMDHQFEHFVRFRQSLAREFDIPEYTVQIYTITFYKFKFIHDLKQYYYKLKCYIPSSIAGLLIVESRAKGHFYEEHQITHLTLHEEKQYYFSCPILESGSLSILQQAKVNPDVWKRLKELGAISIKVDTELGDDLSADPKADTEQRNNTIDPKADTEQRNNTIDAKADTQQGPDASHITNWKVTVEEVREIEQSAATLRARVLKEFIRNEMQQGYISAGLTTCLASGPPGVGKSTLECLLFGQIPPEIRISTACIEQAERAVITYQDSGVAEGSEWKKVTADDLKRMCAEQIKANSLQKEANPDQSQDNTTTPGQEDTLTAVTPTPGQEDTPTTVTPIPGQEDTPTAVTPIPGQEDTPTAVTPIPGQEGMPTAVTPIPGQEGMPTAVTTTPGQEDTPTAVTPTPGQEDMPTAVTPTPGQEDMPTAVTPTPGQEGTPTTVTPIPGQEDTPTAVTPIPGQEDTPTAVTPIPGQEGMPTAVTPIPGQEGMPTAVTTTPGQEDTPTAVTPTPGQEDMLTAVTPTPGQEDMPTAVTPTPGQEGMPTAVTPTPGQEDMPTAVTPTPGQEDVPTAVTPTPGQEGMPTAVTTTPGQEDTPTAVTPTPGQEDMLTAVTPTPGQEDMPTAVTPTPGQEGMPTAVTPTPGQEDMPTAVTPTPGQEDVPTAVTPTPGQEDAPDDVLKETRPLVSQHLDDSIHNSESQSTESKHGWKRTVPIHHILKSDDWVMLSETTEILKLMETSAGFRQLLDAHWVHFIDSGGQEGFLEILPAFIRNISLQLLIFKLSEQLRSIPTVEYYNKDGKGYEIGHFTLTNEEMLLKAAKMSLFHQSEVSLPYSDMVSDYPEPKILVVGTFKDQENTTEGIHKKNDRLREVLQPYKDHLIPRSEKEIIYPVNARLAGQGDKEDPVASELRHAIERYSPRLKMKIPLRWYLLELELRRLGLPILSKSRCWEIAQRLQFESEEALEVALRYLHEANLFLYYPDILDSIVFVNSKALLDVITGLFELHIDMRCRDESDIVSDDDLRFCKQAIFSTQNIADCSGRAEYDKKVLPDEDLTNLLQHRLIIADISTEVPEHKYFMPSLLPVLENLNDCRPCETAADPLHIIFPEDCTPNGLFCAMQVQLLSRNDLLQWRIVAPQPTDQIYKNCIQLSIGDNTSHIITLLNAKTHFEVYPHTACPSDILPHILRCIDKSLHKACAAFSYKALHEFAFLCVCGKAPPHSAVFTQEGLTKTCIMYHGKPEPLSSKQILWALMTHHRRDPRFPGITFYGDPLLKMVDSDGCTLARPEIGMCLHIPPKAVPDDKALRLTVWPCLSGPFVAPEGHEFSSPVYLMSPAFHFQKDVELSINHFEKLRYDEDIASMSFATTSFSPKIHTSNHVYTFELLGKGEFKVTSSIGTVNLRHFCQNDFCQVAAVRKRQGTGSSQDDELEVERATTRRKEEHSYCVQLHYSIYQDHSVLAVFVVSLYQELYLKNLESNLKCQFPDHHFCVQPKQPVYLSGDAVELEIPEIEGWHINSSIDPTKIFQNEVDFALSNPNCGSLPTSYPPRFYLTITPSTQAVDSKCVLHVKGLREEFSLSIRLSLRSLLPHTQHQPPQGATASNVDASSTKATRTPLLNKSRIVHYLERISRNRDLLRLGEGLGLDGRELRRNVNSDVLLDDMVEDWLERKHRVDEVGKPSWRVLIKVLRDVGQNGLANDIEEEELN